MRRMMNLGFMGCVFVFASLLFAQEKSELKHVQGSFQVQLIRRESNYVTIQFRKMKADKDDKVIVLEVPRLNEGVLSQGSILEIAATVKEKNKDELEAVSVLLHLDKGRRRLWLSSRNANSLNLEGTSFLKMHGTENDYHLM